MYEEDRGRILDPEVAGLVAGAHATSSCLENAVVDFERVAHEVRAHKRVVVA